MQRGVSLCWRRTRSCCNTDWLSTKEKLTRRQKRGGIWRMRVKTYSSHPLHLKCKRQSLLEHSFASNECLHPLCVIWSWLDIVTQVDYPDIPVWLLSCLLTLALIWTLTVEPQTKYCVKWFESKVIELLFCLWFKVILIKKFINFPFGL